MSFDSASRTYLVAYDRAAVYAILRTYTPRRLAGELRAGQVGKRLAAAEGAELEEHLTAWVQRALADLPLRDALVVDGRRGRRVFALLCVEMTAARAPIPSDLAAAVAAVAAPAAHLPVFGPGGGRKPHEGGRGDGRLSPECEPLQRAADAGQSSPARITALEGHLDPVAGAGDGPLAGDLSALPPALRADSGLAAVGALATRDGLALAVQVGRDDYLFPDDLDTLLPPPPRPAADADSFEPPVGLRRNLAVLLASLGVLLLAVPLLGGYIPDHPAGLPLALITVALLVGIRAGWQGYAGSICIWLVANLPGFRHGTDLRTLWPALPLMAAGLFLLRLDRRVRAMWGWIREWLAG